MTTRKAPMSENTAAAPASAPAAALPAERAALVDLDAVAHNVRALRERLTRPDGSRALLTAVLKADAYGHGAVPVAQAALAAGADRLGVAHVSEALALRAAGVEGEILAWLHTVHTDFAAAVAADVCLGVSGWDLEPVAAAARAAGRTARVHLKLDTGLGRNGATAAQWPELTARAAALQAEGVVSVEGMFSHLAVADEPERAAETDAQLAAFHAGWEQLRAAGLGADRQVVRHLANTPAALSREDLHLDMVRVGLGVYGLSPFPDVTAEELGLRPVMSVRSSLAHVKEVPADQGVSYGHLYRTAGPTRLGLVPLGYADGVPRVAMHAPVQVGGRRLEVVGRVAMDQMVVDLGPDEGAADAEQAGTPVELFGPASGIPADAWAAAAGTINYELVTRLGARLPRIHVHGTPALSADLPPATEEHA